MPTIVSSTIFRSVRRWCCSRTRILRERLARWSSSIQNRDMYSSTNRCPSRSRWSAYVRRNPLTYAWLGRTSKFSASSALRYLARIRVACSTSGISRPLRARASRRLLPISNIGTRFYETLPSAASVGEEGKERVEAEGEAGRQRDPDRDHTERAAEPRGALAPTAA